MIVAAADGSSLNNPGPAGWAWYVDADNWAAGGWASATNNRGELMAVLDLLYQTEAASEPLLIYCDSQYVINSLTKWMAGWKRNGWRKADKKPVQNVDLLQDLDAALAGREVTFEWVKGHAGHALNEAADERARAVALAYQNDTPIERGPGFTRSGSSSRPDATHGKVSSSRSASPRGEGASGRRGLARSEASRRPDIPASAPQPELTPSLFDGIDSGDDAGEAIRVVDLEKSLLTDAVRSSRDKVAALLDPDFVEIGRTGRIWTRGRMLAEVTTLAEIPEFELIGAFQVAPHVIQVRWRERSGRDIVLRTSLWRETPADGWRLLFHQATPAQQLP